MGAVGGLFGLGGGAGGTGFAAPSLAPIQTPVTGAQVDQSYQQNQDALVQQQALLKALQGQNGIGNQSQVYGQLQQVASGQGPNPAQAMLNQSTGQNVANQAALMAGQRGSSANAGLIAREAAQQGAGIQQQSAGQAAVLQAQQSLNALTQAGNIANTQVANQIGATNSVTGANQAQYGNLVNAVNAQNSAQVSNQGSVNSANAQLGAARLGGQQGAIGGLFNAAGAGASSLFNNKTPDPASTGNEGTANPLGTSSNSAYAPGSTAPGPYAPNEAYGGMIKGYDNGGTVTPNESGAPQQGPASSFGQFVSRVYSPPTTPPPPEPAPQSSSSSSGSSALGSGLGSGVGSLFGVLGTAVSGVKKIGEGLGKVSSSTYTGSGGVGPGGGDNSGGGESYDNPDPSSSGGVGPGGSNSGPLPQGRDLPYNSGGMVDVVLSPGEKVIPPGKASKAAVGKVEGKTVPGKAKITGDSYANDTYKTKLPPGSIVVPRSRVNDAAGFVRETLAKRGKK